MGKLRDYLIEKGLYESLSKIYFKGKELQWNPNKTEKEFKDRIKQRTSLNEQEFMKTIQNGINRTKLPIDSSICLYFVLSKFVLVLNTKEMIITTIRDGRWDKPGNICKNTLIANEDVIKMDQNEMDYINEQKYFSIDVNENFDLILTPKCNYCFKVEL